MSKGKSIIKPYRGIIFDMDGTLTRTNQLIFDTFNHVTEKYLHYRLTPSEITAMFGPPEDIAIKKLLGESRFEQAMEDFYNYYRAHHNEKAGMYDGISEILQSLHSTGIPLALFTGKGRPSTDITLEEFGLNNFFTVVITGHDVTRHKPSGEGIQKALRHMEIGPEDGLMIGDSAADVKASREAGVDVATVLWDSYGYDKVIDMDTTYQFFSIHELRQWIDEFIINYAN